MDDCLKFGCSKIFTGDPHVLLKWSGLPRAWANSDIIFFVRFFYPTISHHILFMVCKHPWKFGAYPSSWAAPHMRIGGRLQDKIPCFSHQSNAAVDFSPTDQSNKNLEGCTSPGVILRHLLEKVNCKISKSMNSNHGLEKCPLLPQFSHSNARLATGSKLYNPKTWMVNIKFWSHWCWILPDQKQY